MADDMRAAGITASGALAGAIIAAVAGFAGVVLENQWHNRDLDGRMVGLAIDVLKSDCKSAPGLMPAREWAVAIIQRFSAVPLDESAKAALVHNSIAPGAFSSDFSSGFDIARNPCGAKDLSK